MAANNSSARGKHTWLKWTGMILLVVFIVLGVAIGISVRRAEPMLRAVIVEKLSDHFHARVELDQFHISVANGLWAEGKGLRIWPPVGIVKDGSIPGPTASIPPLIQLNEFRFHAPLEYKPNKPIHIALLEMKGLTIDVPPKSQTAKPPTNGEIQQSAAAKPLGPKLVNFEIESIQCTGAHLTLGTSKPGKLPLEFAIAHVTLSHFSPNNPMDFNAQLTNPKPAGTIETSGTIGPWMVEDPGETPLAGDYRFEHADLGVFKGIAGILESMGKFDGSLRDMAVEGETTTPNFQLTQFGTAVQLRTHFQAMVDGTNGDTHLKQVSAMLGQSRFLVSGEIIRQQAETMRNGRERPGGREIALKVNMDRARIEDFLRLTSKSGTPLLTGYVTCGSTVEIPPGTDSVLKRLKLNGRFELDDAQFTSEKIQNDVRQLSLRGQGDTKGAKNGGDENVRSAMQSDFTLMDSTITLPNLEYTVLGAEIDVKGKYGIDGGTLDFVGTARTQATVSQMVGGWKGMLLRPADRFFKKNGSGTEVPIHINGTREDPKFGVDFNRMKHTSPATPGAQP